MFCIPAILNKRHGNLLPRCWLAGILGERMFRRKFDNYQINEYDIADYCKEILLVVNAERANYRRQFSLHLYSDLMFGVVKLHGYQFMLFEKSVFDLIDKIHNTEISIVKESTKGREQIRGAQPTTFSQVPIDELLMPLTPELNLDRPFRRDTNLLIGVSPESRKSFKQLNESHAVPLSPLTASQADRWVFNDERGLWPGVDPSTLPTLELSVAASAVQPDPPLHTVRTPTKRKSAAKNIEAPFKRQRPSRVPQTAAMNEERMGAEVAVVLPMEQDDEPVAVLVEPMVSEAPEEPLAPVDFITEVDSALPVVPMDQDNEPHPFERHQVDTAPPEEPLAPVDSIAEVAPAPAVVPTDQDNEPHHFEEHPVVTAAPEGAEVPVHAVNQLEIDTIPAKPVQLDMPAGRRAPRRSRFRVVSVIKSISVDQLKQRKKNLEAHTVSQTNDAIPSKRLIKLSSVIRLPSTIFNFDVESIPRNRLRAISDEVLRRYKTNICGPFVVDVDNTFTGLPRGVRQQRSYEMPTVLGDVANAANLTDEGTIVEPTGINIAPPAEAPQPEAPGEPAFDTTGGAEHLLSNIDNREPSANTSEAITVSIGRVRISSPDSRAGEHHRNLSPSDPAVHSPLPRSQVTRKKSSHSKTPSSSEHIIDAGSESPSPTIVAPSVYTRKDLEACLQVYWHDNNVINFEQLASPDATSDADATACFMLLLDMYKENKVILTQARTHAPIYIEKVVPSDDMDCS